MDLGLSGRTAVVAASTSGLGLAVGRALAAERANVVLFGRRGDVASREAARLPSALGIEGDLTDPHTPKRVTNAALERFGSIDILVWNSGGPSRGSAEELTPAAFNEAVSLMVDPFLRFIHLLIPSMRSRGWGRVVAIGSSGVQQPIPDLALSNALRASIAGLCKTLAGELARDGITVNMVLPGRIATNRIAALDAARAQRDGLTEEEVAARSKAQIPAARYGSPEEFGQVAAFLCGEPSSYITGSEVRVDGGLIGSSR